MSGIVRPLYNRSVLLTRPVERSAGVTRKLEALGARVEARPTIALELPEDPAPARRAIEKLASYDWLLFTSPSGVRFFCLLAQRVLGHTPKIGNAVAAIGPSTARALQESGIRARVVAANSRAEGLAEALGGQVKQGHRVLLVRPEVAREILPSALRSGGALVDAVPFYRNVASADVADIARDVRREVFDVVVFTSPSVEALRRVKVVAIGEVTARALEEAGMSVGAVASKPSDEGIVEAIQGLF
jgi:uroporphyrinogen III methyltransferase/synthase